MCVEELNQCGEDLFLSSLFAVLSVAVKQLTKGKLGVEEESWQAFIEGAWSRNH